MEPILVVNFRDGLLAEDGPQKAATHAAKLVAYCNAPVDNDLPEELAVWPALRAKNGRPAAYNVKYIQIGNETWAFSRKIEPRPLYRRIGGVYPGDPGGRSDGANHRRRPAGRPDSQGAASVRRSNRLLCRASLPAVADPRNPAGRQAGRREEPVGTRHLVRLGDRPANRRGRSVRPHSQRAEPSSGAGLPRRHDRMELERLVGAIDCQSHGACFAVYERGGRGRDPARHHAAGRRRPDSPRNRC